jgi:GNAT superfamily N-acetyltransferase
VSPRRIRPARGGDAAAIAALYIDTWRTAYAGLLPDRVLLGMSQATQQPHWARQIGGADTVLVAVNGQDQPIGVASGGGCRDRRFRGAGEVFTLYVSPSHQGQGHGKALFDEILSAHSELGRDSALLWVLARNPSRFFYEAMGGVRVAERDESLWGVVLPEIAYQWTLLPRSGVTARYGASSKQYFSPPKKR